MARTMQTARKPVRRSLEHRLSLKRVNKKQRNGIIALFVETDSPLPPVEQRRALEREDLPQHAQWLLADGGLTLDQWAKEYDRDVAAAVASVPLFAQLPPELVGTIMQDVLAFPPRPRRPRTRARE